jgi:F-type H+-transporting ATPase subunit epsilon
MSLLKVKVLSPDKPVADVAASSVKIPGFAGYLEILPGHANLISEVGVGELFVKRPGESDLRYSVAGGYLEASPTSLVVLADVLEVEGQIDRQRAEKAAKRAQDRLVTKDATLDVGRALNSLRRANERLAFVDRQR